MCPKIQVHTQNNWRPWGIPQRRDESHLLFQDSFPTYYFKTPFGWGEPIWFYLYQAGIMVPDYTFTEEDLFRQDEACLEIVKYYQKPENMYPSSLQISTLQANATTDHIIPRTHPWAHLHTLLGPTTSFMKSTFSYHNYLHPRIKPTAKPLKKYQEDLFTMHIGTNMQQQLILTIQVPTFNLMIRDCTQYFQWTY